MQVTPDFTAFEASLAAGRPVLVWTSFVADLETPVSAMLKLADGRPNSFLFESVEGGASRGRYSVIGLKPDLIWRCYGDRAEINRHARFDPDAFITEEDGALQSLRRLVAECRVETPAPLPPMASGLFGYMGYNMVALMERLPDRNPDLLEIPDGLFLRPSVISIFDNIADRVTLVTTAWPNADLSVRAAYDQAQERLADVLADFERSLPHRRENPESLRELPAPTGNVTRDQYMAMVETAKEYIRAGEVFQVVPSMR
ncbi:MAG: anthranilate synthase component I, partial [Stellaceae bacterium]